MPIDPQEFRRTLGQFATGVTVVAVRRPDGSVHGMTANSFTLVSLDPPLILVCVDKRAATHAHLQEQRRFAVSVLLEDQEDVSRHFAGRKDVPVQVEWRTDQTASPILHPCLAWVDCSVVAEYPGGDHTIFLAAVERLGAPGGRPLLFFSGKYSRLP